MNKAFIIMRKRKQNGRHQYLVTVDVTGKPVELIDNFEDALSMLTIYCDEARVRNARVAEIQYEQIRDYQVLGAYTQTGKRDEEFLVGHPRLVERDEQ